MNKNLLTLLAMLFMVFLFFPGTGRAGGSNDFMALQVPHVSQAASFFERLMNCDAVDQNADRMETSLLLDCGNGDMVELSGTPRADHAERQHRTKISFTTADATSTLRWLHSQGIVIVGYPVKLQQANGQEETIVNFVAPWGQTMQLVSYVTSRAPRIGDAHAIPLASP